jgi:hypothetical protein
MSKLPDVAWAWEFLRRDPDYPSVYSKYLLQPADPGQDARQAEVFWRKDVCSSVLPVESIPEPSAKTSQHLSLDGMRCHVAVIDDEGTHHVLFRDEGRFLQLEVHGPLTGAVLLTPALLQEEEAPSRLVAMRRLSDLVTRRSLRPELYPPERRAARFLTMIKALDGSLLKLCQRDIAVRIFGPERVAKEWSDPGNYMRDQVRRAIRSGRRMMAGGYRRLLG